MQLRNLADECTITLGKNIHAKSLAVYHPQCHSVLLGRPYQTGQSGCKIWLMNLQETEFSVHLPYAVEHLFQYVPLSPVTRHRS